MKYDMIYLCLTVSWQDFMQLYWILNHLIIFFIAQPKTKVIKKLSNKTSISSIDSSCNKASDIVWQDRKRNQLRLHSTVKERNCTSLSSSTTKHIITIQEGLRFLQVVIYPMFPPKINLLLSSCGNNRDKPNNVFSLSIKHVLNYLNRM